MRIEARDRHGKVQQFECGTGYTDEEILRKHGLHEEYTVTVWPTGCPEQARIIQQGAYRYG